MKSFIPWVGGKGKLLWILNKLAPERYEQKLQEQMEQKGDAPDQAMGQQM